MNLEGAWLQRGFFNFSQQKPRTTTTTAIRDELCRGLGLGRGVLHIANYPTRANWRHTLWWRDGKEDHVEAQFFAQIAKEHPVLSLGISVEKGLEDQQAAGPKYNLMVRPKWDWVRLVQHLPALLKQEVFECAAQLGSPLLVRLRARCINNGETLLQKRRTYALVDGSWFDRHKGTTTPQEIAGEVCSFDSKADWYVDLHFCCDFAPEEVDGMRADEAAEILLKFNPIRVRLRR